MPLKAPKSRNTILNVPWPKCFKFTQSVIKLWKTDFFGPLSVTWHRDICGGRGVLVGFHDKFHMNPLSPRMPCWRLPAGRSGAKRVKIRTNDEKCLIYLIPGLSDHPASHCICNGLLGDLGVLMVKSSNRAVNFPLRLQDQALWFWNHLLDRALWFWKSDAQPRHRHQIPQSHCLSLHRRTCGEKGGTLAQHTVAVSRKKPAGGQGRGVRASWVERCTLDGTALRQSTGDLLGKKK